MRGKAPPGLAQVAWNLACFPTIVQVIIIGFALAAKRHGTETMIYMIPDE